MRFDGPACAASLSSFSERAIVATDKLVPEINAFRKSRHDADGKYIGPFVNEAADTECFTENGLTPCVSCVRAGDLVIFGANRKVTPRAKIFVISSMQRLLVADTAMFHGGCSAEDPSGETGNGPNELLRAIFILGMTPTRLKTAEELHARRLCYELDLNWYPDSNHKMMVKRCHEMHKSMGGSVENVREFADASEEIKHWIDPTWREAKL